MVAASGGGGVCQKEPELLNIYLRNPMYILSKHQLVSDYPDRSLEAVRTYLKLTVVAMTNRKLYVAENVNWQGISKKLLRHP